MDKILVQFLDRLILFNKRLLVGFFAFSISTTIWAQDIIDGLDEEAFPLSSEFTVDITGCKLENDDGTYDPDGGSLICADGAYVQGNLGSMYNELDLVPHRVEIDAKNSDVLPGFYQLVVGADNLISTDPLIVGYDAAKLVDTDGCNISFVGGIQVGDFGIGGAITQAVQVIEVEQTEDLCVIDFVMRLAITSSNITGSSNRSFVYAGGAESLPIPNVEDPFLFSKTMNGLRDSEYDWTITKSANPTEVDFGNTCEKNPQSDYENVDITVGWTRVGPVLAGDVSVTTAITIDNPSMRTLKFDVDDEVFDGLSSIEGPTSISTGTCPGGSFDGDLLVIEPTEVVVCTLSWTDVTYDPELDLNDIAAGDIVDPIILDTVPLGEATASASIESSGIATNETADIADSEWMIGDNVEFLVSSVTSGTAIPMSTLVSAATDPNTVEWTRDGVNSNGSATLSKMIYFISPTASVGYLRDTATLTGSDGLVRNAPGDADYLQIDIETNPQVELTISKTIPFALTAGDAGDPNEVVFDFDITGPNAYASNRQITFEKPEAGDSDTTLSVTIENLAPGTYTVTENSPTGWAVTTPESGMRELNLDASSYEKCAGTAAFSNEPDGDLVAKAVKVTVPKKSGSTSLAAGWTMTLDGPGTPNGGESKQTACTGDPEVCGVEFDTELQFGNYTITETGMAGWDGQSSGQCSFSVTLLDLIFGKEYICTWTNTQRGTVVIEKDTLPAQTDYDFDYNEDISQGGSTFSLTGVTGFDTETFYNVVPGSYDVSEDDPSPNCGLGNNPCTEAWDLVGLVCEDDADENGYDINPSSPQSSTVQQKADIELDPGETVHCTFTNQLRGQVKVTKTVNGLAASGYQFDIRSGNSVIYTDTSDLNGMVDFDDRYFLPGNYALCEQEVDAGWTSSLENDANAFYPIGGDNSYVCVPFTLDAGELEEFVVENSPPPGGNARTIGYWRNWSGDCTNGNQDDKLGEALASGASLGLMTWPGGDVAGYGTLNTCDAVQIISKRNLHEENRAFDPAYALASQFLAYQLNVNAGADGCGLGTKATEAHELLSGVNFNGLDPASGNKRKDSAYVKNNQKAPWIALASLFDDYNNNDLACPYAP